MIKMGIKYCGGCNPHYDRVELVRRLEERLGAKAEFVSPPDENVDLVMAVEGCRTACADLSPFNDKDTRVITKPEEAEEFVQEILG